MDRIYFEKFNVLVKVNGQVLKQGPIIKKNNFEKKKNSEKSKYTRACALAAPGGRVRRVPTPGSCSCT